MEPAKDRENIFSFIYKLHFALHPPHFFPLNLLYKRPSTQHKHTLVIFAFLRFGAGEAHKAISLRAGCEHFSNKLLMSLSCVLSGSVCCVHVGTVGERGDQVAERSLQPLLRGNQMVSSPRSPTASTIAGAVLLKGNNQDQSETVIWCQVF